MASRVKANAASNLAVRPRLGRLPVPKALPHQKENEKDWSVATSQRQVALAAPAKISISRAASKSNSSSNNQECHPPVQPLPAKISISRAASKSNSSSNNQECHPPVQPLPVKVSINQAASIINASSSPQYRRQVKKAALPELREVLMAKAVANTKPKA